MSHGFIPSFLRTHMLAELPVKAAFACPALVGAEVVAVLEFFSRRSVEPNAGFLDVMEPVGTQPGRVVERERARIALQQSEEHFCTPAGRRSISLKGRTLAEGTG